MAQLVATLCSRLSRSRRRFLHSRYAVLLTHGSLTVLTGALFALLWFGRFWVVFFPCVILGHRIGILLHEYMHGIPFQRLPYQSPGRELLGRLVADVRALGALPGDAPRAPQVDEHRAGSGVRDREVVALSGSRPGPALEPRRRPVFSLPVPVVPWATSVRTPAPNRPWSRSLVGLDRFWDTDRASRHRAEGAGDLHLHDHDPRGAVEHHSYRGDQAFSNEYRVLIPLFNLNKHHHHHEEPRRPWYLLDFRTPQPLTT